MLTPQQVQGIADDLSIIYSRVETECVASIAKHIASGKRITEASLWQMKKLSDVGALKKDLLWRIKKESGVALPQIRKVVESAMERSLNEDIRIARFSLDKSGGMDKAKLYESIKESPEFKRILNNAIAGCKDAMNLTATKALQSSIASYTKAINTAYLKMASGNYSYADAVREAVQEIGKSGIRIVDGKKSIRANELVKKNGTTFTTYKNGDKIRLYPLDSAIRRDLTTQINRACGELTINDAGEVGTDLVVTSWHMGARPEHERWQGKVFSLTPNNKRYPYFYDSQEKGGTGYGDMLGLCGINCYHSFNPYFDGDDINNGDQPTKEENEKAYAEQQQQRTYERSLRSLKRQQVALRESGHTEEARLVQTDINRVSSEYKAFLDKTGRSRVAMLDQVSGYHPIKASEPIVKEVEKVAEKVVEKAKDAPMLAGVSQGKPMTFEEADSGRANPHYSEGGKYTINCQTCVVANEARRRGFDVEALPKVTKHQEILSYGTNKAWKDANGNIPDFLTNGDIANTKRAVEWMDDTVKSGERYHLNVFWRNANSGHIVCLERLDDELTLFDPQTGRAYKGKDNVLHYFDYRPIEIRTRDWRTGNFRGKVRLLRVDNLDFNMDMVNDIMKKAGS